MRKEVVTALTIFLFLIAATVLVVLYGKGYRIDLGGNKPTLSGTGLLVVTSQPDGAQVFINGHLTTATNNTIDLEPKEYTVKIVKEGYFPWEKKIKIKKEVVSKVEALLFPTAPRLESITDNGVANPIIDPSKTRIAFNVASQSAKKNGIYTLDMGLRPILTLQSSSVQIVSDIVDEFSKALISWSPDGQEILATISGQLSFQTTYLLKTSGLNDNPKDVSEILPSVNAAWAKQRTEKEKSRIFGLKPKLKTLIGKNFKIISWSMDETKILYSASESATLPLVIDPPLLGTDSTPQERLLQKDSVYVYDIKEDKNFMIDIGNLIPRLRSGQELEIRNYQGSQPLIWFPSLTWFPDSKHLIFVNNRQINIMEYDGTNKTIFYAGPFINDYIFSWPDGSKIVVLTNLGNPTIAPNLYTIGLK